jgi:hypothetical protein
MALIFIALARNEYRLVDLLISQVPLIGSSVAASGVRALGLCGDLPILWAKTFK